MRFTASRIRDGTRDMASKRRLPDEPDFRPARTGFVRGRLNDDPRAIGLMVPGLGVVFISKNGLSIGEDEEIRRGS